MTIRRATKADLSDIDRLEGLIFSGRDDLFSRAQLRYLLSSPNSAVFIIFQRTQPIGYGIALVNKLRNKELKGRIYSIGLLPDWQNRGIGSVFLKALEKWLNDKGVAFITLETRTDRKGAKDFFKKMSYRPIAILPRYYKQSDGLRMVRVVKKGYRLKRFNE